MKYNYHHLFLRDKPVALSCYSFPLTEGVLFIPVFSYGPLLHYFTELVHVLMLGRLSVTSLFGAYGLIHKNELFTQ